MNGQPQHNTCSQRNLARATAHGTPDNSDPLRDSICLQVLVLACLQDPGLCVRMPHAGCAPDTMLDCQICFK